MARFFASIGPMAGGKDPASTEDMVRVWVAGFSRQECGSTDGAVDQGGARLAGGGGRCKL